MATSEGRCICRRFVAVTEAAALAAAEWLGRGDGVGRRLRRAGGHGRGAWPACPSRAGWSRGAAAGSDPRALRVGDEVGERFGAVVHEPSAGSEGLTVDAGAVGPGRRPFAGAQLSRPRVPTGPWR